MLVIIVLDELHDDLFLRLDLQHLQHKAKERSGLSVTAEGSADVVELHGFVDERLRRETEALLLPECVILDLCPHDLLHEVLRVRSSYVLR